jgi:cyclase
MNPADENPIADIFAQSDAGELPRLIGARRRELFTYQGLYFHLVEGERPVGPAVADVRSHPLFVDINARLDAYISPYDPATWRGPADAMARSFYSWESPRTPAAADPTTA